MGKGFDWKQFFVGVLGTAIGVGLTFFVSGLQQKRNKEHAQRLTAIMVIHDIDNTVDMLKSLKEEEEKDIKLIEVVQKMQDRFDTVPFDTLYQILNILSTSERDFRFDTSKEQIFNSDLDTWQNLGSMKFLDNVQNFFHQRRILQEVLNQPDFFREPISRDEYLGLVRGLGWVSRDEYAKVLRPFLKEKLRDPKVVYYINLSGDRINTYNRYINGWNNLNEENKFVMGLTDKELEAYVNSISNNGRPLSVAQLAGRWEFPQEDDNSYEYEFNRDNTASLLMHYSAPHHGPFWSGRLKYTVSFTGTWSLKADSLYMKFDSSSADVQMDASGLETTNQDSLDAWVNRYREDALKYYQEPPEDDTPVAYKACLDATHDKMEWTSDNSRALFLKRK